VKLAGDDLLTKAANADYHLEDPSIFVAARISMTESCANSQ